MRETIGTSWIFGLVLTFILLFASFLVLTLNYYRVFDYKNDILTILEKYEGYTSNSSAIINNYLTSNNYSTKGSCPDGYYGATSLDSSILEESASSAYYCLNLNGDKIKIILFYDFNLPVIGDIIVFDIEGQTNVIKYLEFDY